VGGGRFFSRRKGAGLFFFSQGKRAFSFSLPGQKEGVFHAAMEKVLFSPPEWVASPFSQWSGRRLPPSFLER